MQIPVYIICEGDPKSSNVAKLVSLFQDNCFDIFIISSKDMKGSKGKGYSYSLNHAKTNYPDSCCIVIRDCMFSNLSDGTMSCLIHKIIDGSNECDKKYGICYLARYLDICDGSVVESGVTTGGSIVTTKYAKGDDGILYTPEARDIMLVELEESKKSPSDILSHLIKKNCNAVAVSPPALQYNPTFGDLKKTWECKSKDGPGPQPPNNNSTTSYSWLWFILLFFIIIVALWACWR